MQCININVSKKYILLSGAILMSTIFFHKLVAYRFTLLPSNADVNLQAADYYQHSEHGMES